MVILTFCFLHLMKGTAGKPGADGEVGEPGIGGSRVSLTLFSGFIQSTNTLAKTSA